MQNQVFYFTPQPYLTDTVVSCSQAWRYIPQGCWIDFSLRNEAGQTLTSGTYQLTQQQVNDWGTDNSVLIGYTAQELNLTVIASPAIQIDGDLEFGFVNVGEKSTKQVTLNNTGAADMIVSAVKVGMGYTVDWTSGIIKGGASQAVNVTFEPINTQYYNSTFDVQSNAVSGNGTIPCTGAGQMIPTPPQA